MSHSYHPSRRDFVRRAGMTAGMGSLSPLVSTGAEDPPASRSPDDILAMLLEGNKRFMSGKTNLVPRGPEDFARDVIGQAPPAIILGCSDSRVPPEFVFDQPLGGLFVLRVAGNIVGSGPILKGSIEFAVAELGARLIIVLGHSGCGAVNAAIEHIEGNDNLPGSIGEMVNYIRPIVPRVAGRPGNKLLNATKENAISNARRLEGMGPILPELVKKRELKAVGAYYVMKTGKVEILS